MPPGVPGWGGAAGACFPYCFVDRTEFLHAFLPHPVLSSLIFLRTVHSRTGTTLWSTFCRFSSALRCYQVCRTRRDVNASSLPAAIFFSLNRLIPAPVSIMCVTCPVLVLNCIMRSSPVVVLTLGISLGHPSFRFKFLFLCWFDSFALAGDFVGWVIEYFGIEVQSFHI